MAYPGSLDTFTTKVDFTDTVLAAHMNAVQSSVVAIQTEIGVAPKTISDAVAPGASPASVAEYLDMVASQLKLAVGGANWYTAPAITLATLAARTITAGAGLTGGGTLAADRTIALDTPGTLTDATTNVATGSHTHAVTASAAPGAAASLLKSTAGGGLTLVSASLGALTMTGNIGGTSFSVNPSATLTLAPADLVLDPSNNAVTPATTADIALGSPTKRWSAIYAASLTVDSLVPISTAVSMGGRLLVGVSTKLIADCAAGDATIDVALNFITNGDVLYLEHVGKTEWMLVTSTATGITGGYRYSVTRAHGTGTAQQWYAGDLVFDTGQAGSGWIDLYAQTAVKSATEAGPTIALNVRSSTTYDDWGPRAAIGNLKGLYGLTANAYGIGLGSYAAGKYLLYDGSALRLLGDLVVGPGLSFSSAALLYCRYDGPAAGYRVTTTGHLGQPATITGGVIGREGPFGKSVQLGVATANLVLNPSFETNATSWLAAGAGTTITRITTDSYVGSACLQVAAADVGGAGVYSEVTTRMPVTDGTSYTWSLGVKAVSSATYKFLMRITWYDAGGSALAPSTSSAKTATTAWGTYSYTAVAPAGATTAAVYLIRNAGGTATYNIDAVQFEALAYPTPYCDGSLGTGHTWSGTAHASTSARTAARLSYATPGTGVAGTVAAWVYTSIPSSYAPASTDYDIVAECNYGSNGIMLGAAYGSGGAALYGWAGGSSAHGTILGDNTWTHVALTWNGTTIALYINGVLAASTAQSAPCTFGTDVFAVGAWNTASNWNGRITDLALLSRALSANEVYALYGGDGLKPATITTQTFHLMLTAADKGMVSMHAGGIFATNALGAPTWSLLNEDTTINGEALGEGDVLLGDNTASKANLLWDKSAGKLLFRGGTTMQVEIGTDGALTAGAGAVRLDSTGIAIVASTSYADIRAYKFVTSAGATVGGLYGYSSSGYYVKLLAEMHATEPTNVSVIANGNSTYGGNVGLYAGKDGSGTAAITVSNNNILKIANINVDTVIEGGLNVGSATSAATGNIRMSGDVIQIGTQKTPASAGAAGTKGDICHDASWVYVCTATDTWKRAAIATW